MQASLLHCAQHTNYPLDRVDPDPNAQKHLFCTECLLQHEDGIALYKQFPLLKDFISNTANVFHEEKSQAKPYEQLPSKYLIVTTSKAERLSKVSATMEQQKAQVITFFDQFKASLMKIINQYQEKYLKILDDQVNEICKSYEDFEQEVKRAYPTVEDLNNLYPTLDQINKTLEEIKEVPNLEEYVKSLKQTLEIGNAEKDRNFKGQQSTEVYLDTKAKTLEKPETQISPFLLKVQDQQAMEEETFSLLDKILSNHQPQNNLDKSSGPLLCLSQSLKSRLLTFENLLLLKSWLPSEQVFDLQLLYRGSRDGFNGKAFHRACDYKGPTITVMKCEFQGASEPTVIGGFLDKDWQPNDHEIISKDSFLFSIPLKLKCELKQKGVAAFGYPLSGPCFGNAECMDLYVSKNFAESYMNPGAYKGAENLVNIKNYRGGFARFNPLEIEVYRLN